MDNLYWNVYKNLEKELLLLADTIHINDKQLEVYSVKIADLLVRTAVEVESISKALYYREGGEKSQGKNLNYDEDCINLLNEHWTISEKVVLVSSPYLYFEKDENKILTPLYKANKRGDKSSDWNKAYQAVKHNRVVALEKGNLKHFTRALAALYILNLYYLNQTFDLGKESNVSAFNASVGSSVFSVMVHKFPGIDATGEYKKGTNYNQCIYLIQATDKTKLAAVNLLQKLGNEFFERFKAEIKADIEQGRGEHIDVNHKRLEVAHEVLSQNANIFGKSLNSLRYEAVLNKNQY